MSRILRVAVLVIGVLSTSIAATGVASAHVTVNSADASQGGFGVLNFRVPNESDTAGTIEISVQLPDDTPIAFVQTTATPGWTVSVTRVNVDPPIEVFGEQITEAVGVVTWTAQPGTRIGPGEYAEFSLSAGPLPEVDSLVFKAIQLYDDGMEVAWIEETVEGEEEPEHPAPVLAVSAASDEGQDGSTDESDVASPPNSEGSASDETGSGLAITALVVGVVGLIAGVLGLVFALSARRRTV